MQNLRLQAMIEAAIFAALALVLDLIPSIKLSPSISISFAMVPVFIIALRWGFKFGMISGLLWALLQLIFDPWIVHPVQAIMDYILAFSFIGFAGLLKNIVQRNLLGQMKGKAITFTIIAIFIGSVARYFWSFLSGVIFIEYFAPDELNPIWFSFSANGISMLGAFVFCSIIMSLLILASPRFFILKKN